MNKLLLTMAILIYTTMNLLNQTKISGIVKDDYTEKEIYNLNVLMLETGESVRTDRIGYFQFVDVAEGTYTLPIAGIGYQPTERIAEVDGNTHIYLGQLFVTYNPASIGLGIITLTDDKLEADAPTSQSSADLLHSSSD